MSRLAFLIAWIEEIHVQDASGLRTSLTHSQVPADVVRFHEYPDGLRSYRISWPDGMAIRGYPRRLPIFQRTGVEPEIELGMPNSADAKVPPSVAHIVCPSVRGSDAIHVGRVFDRIRALISHSTRHNPRDFSLTGYMFGHAVYLPLDAEAETIARFAFGDLKGRVEPDSVGWRRIHSPTLKSVPRWARNRHLPALLPNLGNDKPS